MKTVYSVCGMCGTRCPVAVGVENGEAVWIQGNPHSATGSTLCPRGIAALALEKDSERPQSPLMRVGARGGHKWRAVRWEEALDAVAGKLRAIRDQYGPESVMFSHRGGPFTDLYKAFARGLGTPNIYSHSVTCTRNVDQACASVLGLDRGRLVIDYRESKHIVLQSRNALEALNLAEVAGITAARANGCKVTVMDVRATVSAAKADTFFFVRPGTDYAMNLAVLHVLISEKLYDPHMLPYIDGFGELEERVRPCTPEWAETETGIKADRIVRLARELAEAAPRVLWYPGWFTARYADSFVTVRSAYLINALLGSIGARGGMPISLSPKETGKRLRPLSALYPNITKPMADKADWQQPGLLQLPAGQAPQVHGAALGFEPGAELVAPLAFEVDELRPGRAQARAAHGQKFARFHAVVLAEAAHPGTGEVTTVAAPARMDTGHETAALVGQQDGLAIGGLDDQPKPGLSGGHAIGIAAGHGVGLHGIGLEDHGIAVHLIEFGHAPEAQGRPQFAAVADDALPVIGRGERDVATGVRAVSGLLPAGLEGAAHIVHAGEHKGDETYRHTSPSSVHRQSTGRSQSWEGSASTTWKA